MREAYGWPSSRALAVLHVPVPGHRERRRPGHRRARGHARRPGRRARPAGAGSIGAFASGMGNASFARSVGGADTLARSPAAGAATPPADGVTAALARSVQQRRVAATARPAAPAPAPRPPTGRRARSPTTRGHRAADGRPGDQRPPRARQALQQGMDDEVRGGLAADALAPDPPLPGRLRPLQRGRERRGGRAGEREPRAHARKDAGTTYVDSVKGSGSVAANGLLVGSLSAGLGVGIPGANVKAHASGSLRLSGSGSATVDGTMRRTGGAGSWSGWAGRMTIDGDLKGSLTAAASGYFSWQVLWFDGRFGEFKISEWKLGDASIKLKGWADLQGGSDIKLIPDFSPPQQPKVESRIERRAPQQGQPATGRQLGTKRREGATGGPVFIGAAPAGTAFDAMVARETAPPPPRRPRRPRRPRSPHPGRRPTPPRRRPPAPPAPPPDGQPPSDPNKLPSTPAEAGLPDVEGGGGVAAVPAGPTEPGGA